MMDYGTAILIVGIAFAACPVAIVTIRSRGNGTRPCLLHPVILADIAEAKQTIKEKDEQLWDAVSEIRSDIKELLRRK